MNKTFKLLTVAVAALGIFGLASCAYTQAPTTEPTETPTTEPTTKPTGTPTTEPTTKPTETVAPNPEQGHILMTDSKKMQFGTVRCDVVLMDNNKVKFDVTTGFESYDKKFDKEGTYTVANGVYTFVLEGTEYKTVLENDLLTLKYSIQGDMKIDFTLKGKAEVPAEEKVFMTATTSTNRGDVKCDLILKDASNAVFKIDAGMPEISKMLTKEATYTLANNVYTFTVGEQIYVTTYDEPTGVYSLAYSVAGDITVNFDLKSLK